MSLFGDLFDDESDISDRRNDTRCDSGKKADDGSAAPLAPRPSHGLCGIFNQGATCYLNALIQTLVLTPEFRGNSAECLPYAAKFRK
jgi:ubiquitin carboxyl-terminal hydrolase 40